MKQKLIILTFSIFLLFSSMTACGNSRTGATSSDIPAITTQPLPPAATPEESAAPEESAPDVPGVIPGEDVVMLVSPDGEETTGYKLADGRYMDRVDRIFIFDGISTWTDENGVQWTKKSPLSAEPAIDRFLAQMGDVPTYSDVAEGGKIIFFTQEDLTDLRYLRIEADIEENGEILCKEIKTLFALDELKTDDAFVIETMLEGLLPTRAISFRDASGNLRSFYLAESGEDGMPLLIEYFAK